MVVLFIVPQPHKFSYPIITTFEIKETMKEKAAKEKKTYIA